MQGSGPQPGRAGQMLEHGPAPWHVRGVMDARVVELGPNRRLSARDAGADIVITAPPRDEGTSWFLLGLFGLPCLGLAVLAVAAWRKAPGMSVLALGGAAVCGWLVIGLLGDRRRDRARRPAKGTRLTVRARDAVVTGPDGREQVIALDALLQHPMLDRRDDATVALVRARQAIAKAKPGSPRRIVIEAAAIEGAAVGGFAADGASNRVFVVLHRDARAATVTAIDTSERRVAEIASEEPCWVYAVPTAVHADDMRYPILDVARVIEWKKPATRPDLQYPVDT